MKSFKQFLSESKNSRILVISLIFDGQEEPKVYLKKHLPGVAFANWHDVVIDNNGIKALGKSLTEFSFIIVGKTLDKKNFESSENTIKFIEAHKIPNFKYGFPNKKKITQLVKMQDSDGELAKTLIVDTNNLKAVSTISALGFPLMVKVPASSRGRGVIKLENKKALEKFVSENKGRYVFQQFIESEDEAVYRIVFIKNKFIYAITRIRKNKKEYDTVKFPEKESIVDVPKEAKEVALRAYKTMNLDIGGVDLIQDKNTGKWHVIEINAGPDVSGNEQFNPVMDEIVRIVKQSLKL